MNANAYCTRCRVWTPETRLTDGQCGACLVAEVRQAQADVKALYALAEEDDDLNSYSDADEASAELGESYVDLLARALEAHVTGCDYTYDGRACGKPSDHLFEHDLHRDL